MTHTDLIAPERISLLPEDGWSWVDGWPPHEGNRIEYVRSDALTAAQERIEMAECAGFSAGYEAGQKDAQERIEALEGALSAAVEDLDAWVSYGDDLRSSGYDVDYTAAVARQGRAALDASGKGER